MKTPEALGHKMTEWASTIVRDRFGSERECKECGGEELRWGQGGYHKDSELRKPCVAMPVIIAMEARWVE